MKRVAVTLGIAVLILVGLKTYRRGAPSHVPVSVERLADPGVPSNSLVLPATSTGWASLPVTAFRAARTNNIRHDHEPPSPATPLPLLDQRTVEARTRVLLAQASIDSVGLVPEANQYWLAAVTDDRLAPEERRELILALHQAGLGDPAQPTSEELPLLAARVALLEEAAREGVDAQDAAAMQEVHRELLAIIASASAPISSEPAQASSDAEPAR